MDKQKESYEIQGRGYVTVREFCDDLRTKLNFEGLSFTSNVESTYIDGVPVTNNKAIGLVYLLNENKDGVEVSVVSDESSVAEGKNFLDYGFSKATVRPFGNTDVEKVKSGLVEILYGQIRRRLSEKMSV